MPHGLTACLKVIFENLFFVLSAMAGPGLIKILLSSDVGTVSVGEVCAAFASYSNKAAFPPGQIADLDTAIIAVCDDLYPEHCAHFFSQFSVQCCSCQAIGKISVPLFDSLLVVHAQGGSIDLNTMLNSRNPRLALDRDDVGFSHVPHCSNHDQLDSDEVKRGLLFTLKITSPLGQLPSVTQVGVLIVQGGPPHHFLVSERTHQEQVLIYANLQGYKWIRVNQLKPKSRAWGFIFRRHDYQPYSFQPEQYKVIAPSTLNEADQSKLSKVTKPAKKVPIGVNASKYSNTPKPKKVPPGPSRVPSQVNKAPPPRLASPQAAQDNANQPDAAVVHVCATDQSPVIDQRGCPTTDPLAVEQQNPNVCPSHGDAQDDSLPNEIIYPKVGTEANKPVDWIADDVLLDKNFLAHPDCANVATAKSNAYPREKDASPPKRTKFSESHPYAIISLFDGVGSAMPAVIKAIGFAPSIVIAAECDPILRQIVGEQFHFRTDGRWSKTIQHTSAIYVDDVRKLLADKCRVLREAFAIAGPQCCWIVIAGSPCQDLTLAGPLGGLLGLTGPCSSLFYYVHVILWFLQMNYPIELIRFLLENAGTMLDIHRKAILRALGLNLETTVALIQSIHMASSGTSSSFVIIMTVPQLPKQRF